MWDCGMFPMGPPLANEPPAHTLTVFGERAWRVFGADAVEGEAAVLVSGAVFVDAFPRS